MNILNCIIPHLIIKRKTMKKVHYKFYSKCATCDISCFSNAQIHNKSRHPIVQTLIVNNLSNKITAAFYSELKQPISLE